jgi:hypothetical protein
MRLILASVLLLTVATSAQAPFVKLIESVVHGGRQLKGLIWLDVAGTPVSKRYVMRIPSAWNGQAERTLALAAIRRSQISI